MSCISAVVDTGALLSESGMTVLIGVAVVFAVLLLLTCIFWLFGVVAGGGKNSEAKKSVEPAPPVPKHVPAPVVEDGVPDEVVAAIAAAVAAMSDGSTGYAIRRIRPVRTNARPVWAAAGVAENTQPF